MADLKVIKKKKGQPPPKGGAGPKDLWLQATYPCALAQGGQSRIGNPSSPKEMTMSFLSVIVWQLQWLHLVR